MLPAAAEPVPVAPVTASRRSHGCYLRGTHQEDSPETHPSSYKRAGHLLHYTAYTAIDYYLSHITQGILLLGSAKTSEDSPSLPPLK